MTDWLREQARSILGEALQKGDAGDAVRHAIKFSDNSRLAVLGEGVDLKRYRSGVYAIALGKAAYPMALALDEVLGENLHSGVVTGVLPVESNQGEVSLFSAGRKLSGKWRVFAGGHPLPNEASLAAAQTCFEILRSANDERALVIFLVSGGGSAMLEAPRRDSVTLADLREANRLLVQCGATIAEINRVRRSFSLVKGGGLAAQAPNTDQMTLIISDTEVGDEAAVASGPTLEPSHDQVENANSIIERYDLTSRLPSSLLQLIRQDRPRNPEPKLGALRRHHVLLDNHGVLAAAAASARARDFVVDIAYDISQQHVIDGCAELLKRMAALRGRVSDNRIACLISGGEFSCPVRGTGIGGRNAETALRMATALGQREVAEESAAYQSRVAFLSAGTDGIDGNSPSAGAVADNTTLARAQAIGMNSQQYLDASNAYSFFQALGDAIITHPTGTNVRDLRIMLAA